MAPAPPPYQEVTGGPSRPLIVRIQVWHFTRGGRSQVHNQGLANAFSRERLQDWIVRPVDDPECDGASARDDFVPVEVDFENVNGTAGPMLDSQVRGLFARNAPLHVYQYFLSIHSTPHIMNIRPVDKTQRFTGGGRYTYAFVLNSVDIRAHEFAAPAVVAGLEQDQAVSILRGELAVYTLSTIVNAYTLISQQSRRQTHAANPDVLRALLRAEVFQDDLVGDDGKSYLQCLQRRLRQIPSKRSETPCIRVAGADNSNSRSFLGQAHTYGTIQPRHEVILPARDLRDAWNKLRGPLEQYHSRTGGKLGRGINKLCQGQVNTSNQDLYELILDMRKAALHLPAIERSAIPLLNFLSKPHAGQPHPQAIRYLYLSSASMGLVIFCLAVMYLFPPIDSYSAGWTTALMCLTLLGGVAFVATALGARGVVVKEKKNIRVARKAVTSANNSINDALAAVSAIFCRRVLNLPLETVGEHEKRSILGNLGVDVDGLTPCLWEFQPEQLLIERVKMFRDSSTEMDKALRNVMRSAEMRFAVGDVTYAV